MGFGNVRKKSVSSSAFDIFVRHVVFYKIMSQLFLIRLE